MDKEWHILEYENKTYLHKKTLIFKLFQGSEGSHDHCELCWARFSKHPNDLQNGYYDPMSKSWICSDCFNKLATLFEWTVAGGKTGDKGTVCVNPFEKQ